jgi:hypothetical protein
LDKVSYQAGTFDAKVNPFDWNTTIPLSSTKIDIIFAGRTAPRSMYVGTHSPVFMAIQNGLMMRRVVIDQGTSPCIATSARAVRAGEASKLPTPGGCTEGDSLLSNSM